MRKSASRIVEATRATDWWDYKLLAIVQVFAATALTLHLPLASLWRDFALLLAAIAIGAVFASLINDLTDLAEDRRTGKPNQVARMPSGLPVALLSLSVAVGLAMLWHWRDDAPLSVAYLAAWLAFAAYSLPPLRLKARGGWGVAAMALGEAALPSLVAALLCYHAAGRAIDPRWIAAVALWSLGHGARAIVWHQLNDDAADREAGIATFVQRVGPADAARVVAFALFPIELAGLAGMLAMMASPWPLVGLAVYAGVTLLRTRYWRYVAVIVAPCRNHMLVLQDYYLGYLPLAILVAAAIRHPADALAVLAMLLVFPHVSRRIYGETARLALWFAAAVAKRLRRRTGSAA